MIRARTLFPLRNGSATLTAKPTASGLPALSCRSVSRTARGIAARLAHSPRPIWPCSWGRRCSPSGAEPIHYDPVVPLPCAHAILVYLKHRQAEQCQHHFVHFVLVVFHRAPGLEFAARVALRDSDNTGQTPDKARTHTGCRGRGVSGPDSAFFAQPYADQQVYAQSAVERPAGTH